MYTTKNYRTKKALRDDVKNGVHVTVFSPGPFPAPAEGGETTVEGPHYPEPHRWYARVLLSQGRIVKVLP